MGSRRKGPPKLPPPDDRAFAVVLEGVRSDFKVFGESLAAFRDEVRGETQSFRADVDRRFDDVQRQFEGVHRRFEWVEHELVALRVAVQSKVDRQDVEAMVRGVSGSRGC